MAANLRRIAKALPGTCSGETGVCLDTVRSIARALSGSASVSGTTRAEPSIRQISEAQHCEPRKNTSAHQASRPFSAQVDAVAPGNKAGTASTYASPHARRLVTGQQSVDELLGRFEEEKSTTKMDSLASFMGQFDGAAVLLQTGILSANTLQPLTRDVAARLAAYLQSSARSFTVQQATNIVSTMTLLGFHDHRLKTALVDHVLPDVPKAAPETIASLCYALGLEGYSDRRLLREMEAVMDDRLHEFDVPNVAKVVFMFARAHHNTPAVSALVDTLASRALCETASPQTLVYAMWACGEHGDRLDDLADRALHVLPGRISELSGTELAKLAFGLIEAEVREPEIYEEIVAAAEGVMGGMCPRDIAKLVYALGRVQVGDRAFAATIKPHVLAHLERFTYNELDMVVQAYNSWGVYDDTTTKVAQRLATG